MISNLKSRSLIKGTFTFLENFVSILSIWTTDPFDKLTILAIFQKDLILFAIKVMLSQQDMEQTDIVLFMKQSMCSVPGIKIIINRCWKLYSL